MDQSTIRTAYVEAVATFVFVFVGAAAVASGQGVVVAALAHGLILLSLVYVYGHLSGSHVNPAVTLGLLVAGKIDILKAVAYWVAQFLGAIVAAFLLSLLIGKEGGLGQTTGSLTTGNVWAAAAFEAVMTFFLVSAVMQAAVYGKAGNAAGVAIGLTLAASILAGGTYTGASLNPARTFGPALVAGDLSYLLPYFVGIFGGGAIGGLLHGYILKDE